MYHMTDKSVSLVDPEKCEKTKCKHTKKKKKRDGKNASPGSKVGVSPTTLSQLDKDIPPSLNR